MLFVGRLASDTRSRDLEDLFYKFGKITRCDVKRGGFGFVEFDNKRDAEDAIRELDGTSLLGRHIAVEWAKGPRRGSDSSSTRDGDACFKCGESGHWARDCTARGSRGRRSPRSPRRRRDRSPRDKSPRDKSPRDKSPRDKSPRDKSPRDKSPRDKSPRERSPRGKSPRERSPRGKSPRERSPRGKSPRERSPRGKSPRERSPRKDRSSPKRSPKSPVKKDSPKENDKSP